MFKIPFFEHTTIGLEITEENIRWVEIDRLGNKWTLHSYGELRHNQSETTILSGLEEIKESITSDAWHCAVLLPRILKEVIVEELPYFEEQEEVAQWISSRRKEIETQYGKDDEIQYQIIEIDEDTRRIFFQIVDGQLMGQYMSYLKESGFFPEMISTGVTEAGYSQIFEEVFVDDLSGLVHRVSIKDFLTVYSKGVLHNLYPISGNSGEFSYVIAEADSYLKSEENSAELEMSTTPLPFVSDGEVDMQVVERELVKITPLSSKKGFGELSNRYVPLVGLVVKANYPALDEFNFVDTSTAAQGIKQHDKEELIRISVLLYAPLIFFFLLVFGAGRLVEYKLIESNQVMNQIGDQLDFVTEQREELIASRDHFLEVKSLLEKRDITAPVFGIISEEINENIWLSGLTMTKTKAGIQQVWLEGYSRNNRSLTEFLDVLERREETVTVQLLLSESTANRSNRNDESSLPIGTIRFEIIFSVK